MTLIQLVVWLVIMGVLLYLFNTYITTIDATAKKIINFVVVAAMILLCLSAFGVLGALDMPVPRIR